MAFGFVAAFLGAAALVVVFLGAAVFFGFGAALVVVVFCRRGD